MAKKRLSLGSTLARINMRRTYKRDVVILIMFIGLLLYACVHPFIGYEETQRNNGAHVQNIVYGQACGAVCSQGTTALLMSSLISNDTLIRLEQAHANRAFDTLCLYSPGGETNAAIGIMDWLNQKDIATCLASEFRIEEGPVVTKMHCKSMCPLIFLAAKKRTAYGVDFDVAVHDLYSRLPIVGTDKNLLLGADLISLAAFDWRIMKKTGLGWSQYYELMQHGEVTTSRMAIEDLKAFGFFTSIYL